jgi:alanine racemase
LQAIQNKIGKAKIMAVVKANAYGHGMVPIAKAAVKAGAKYLAVASCDEALELRAAGLLTPILIFYGGQPTHALVDLIKQNICLTVASLEDLKYLNYNAKNLPETIKVHIKFDTGMGRTGIPLDQLKYFLDTPIAKKITIEGIYTHFATADQDNSNYLKQQITAFDKLLVKLKENGFKIALVHSNNSAATLRNGCATNCNLVRIGLAMYGIYPSETMFNQHKHILKPALSWITRINNLKLVPANTSIGYGRRYITKKPSYIATIPVGYAEGYPRNFSNIGFVLIKKRTVPVVGTISMNQTTIDVTKIMPVKIGEEVVIYGSDVSFQNNLYPLAKRTNTIPYELITKISDKLPRIYTD